MSPAETTALLDRAVALHRAGQAAQAEPLYRELLAARPDHQDALHLLGLIRRDAGSLDEAVTLIAQAVTVQPNFTVARLALAELLRRLGRAAEAITHYRLVAETRPGDADLFNTLANLLLQVENPAEAEACYRRAIAADPSYAHAFGNLGRLLQQSQRSDEARTMLEQAIALKPDFADACFNLGINYGEANRTDDAVASYSRAKALNPQFPNAHFAACMAELPVLYHDADEIPRRRRRYRRALAELMATVARAPDPAAFAGGVGIQPFYLAYQGACDRALQRRYGAMVHRIMTASQPPPALTGRPAADEPVRVGIVSAFFNLHSNWKIPIRGWLSQLDRRRFRVFGYYPGTVEDSETATAAALCERFVRGPLSLAAWRAAILADAPHVLIYPEVGMHPTILQLAAQRLAPVQCNSWGHPETSGLPTLDYFLSSDLMEPPEADQHYTERLIRLPNLSIYYQPYLPTASGLTRAELGLRGSATVFWSGQSLYKYLPQHDFVFPHLARALGDCQFVFIGHHRNAEVTAHFRRRLEKAFTGAGLDTARYCVFLPRLSMSRFVEAIGLCDIFLDSIDWSGCNSALEALVHDLPIVTLAGRLMRARHSMAILTLAGVTDTITHSIDDYLATAVRLAREPAWRAEIRCRLAAGKARLYGDTQCIAALERFLEQVTGKPVMPAVSSPPNPAVAQTLAQAVADHQAGRLAAAETGYGAVLALEAEHPDAQHLLGVLRHQQGRAQEATDLIRRALRRRPDFAAAHFNLGVSLQTLGQGAEAVSSYHKALVFRPDYPDALLNLGYTLRTLGRAEEAEAAFRKLLAVRPEDAGIHAALGRTLHAQGRWSEALSSLDQALTLAPASVPDLEEIRIARALAELPPLLEDTAQAFPRRTACRDRLRALLPLPPAGNDSDDRALRRLHGAVLRQSLARLFPMAPPLPALPVPPGEPVRVGLVLGPGSAEAVWATAILHWLTALDAARFRLFLYQTAGPYLDQDAARNQGGAPARFAAVVRGPQSLARWREIILADAPHALIYPEIGPGLATDGTVVSLAALRLAPVQCMAPGYPVTSGLASIDYVLSSNALEPDDAESAYTEELIRLPGLPVPAAFTQPPPTARPVPPTRAELGLPGHVPVFWCGQRLEKHEPEYDAVFARLAHRVGDCRFLFRPFAGGAHGTALFRRRLERAFAAWDLKADAFCVLLPPWAPDHWPAAVGVCDVVLDGIGWSDAESMQAALDYGVPVVTLPGATLRRRYGAAVLERLGVTDTIARDEDDYVARAAGLAADPALRQALGKRMTAGRPRLAGSDIADTVKALASFLERAVRPPPHLPVLMAFALDRAVSLIDSQRPAEALPGLDRAVARWPGLALGHFYRGLALKALKRTDEAEVAYRRSLALDANDAHAHTNLGTILHGQGHYQEARLHYARARALDPKLAAAWANDAVIDLDEGDVAAATAGFRRAVEANPEDGDCRLNLAIMQLLAGDWEAAWPNYEARRKLTALVPKLPEPEWDGTPLNGRSIALYGEQGLGDVIQFCRYAPLLKERGAGQITVVCRRELASLMTSLPGISGVVAGNSPFPAHDCHALLMSLPRLLGTTPATIPVPGPYLTAPPARVAAWRRRLDEASAGLVKVGLAWRGNPNHPRDRFRSLPAATLAPLLAVPGVRWFSLQAPALAEDLETLRQHGPIEDLAPELVRLEELAAALTVLDVVICVDTMIAHLSGALGVPAWVMLPVVPDWRWQRNRDDSPWYPSLHLFRQPHLNDWPAVVDAVAAEARRLPQPVSQHLDRARDLHQRGEIAAAAALYRHVLYREPHNPDALCLSGVLAGQQGHPEQAVALIRQAVALCDTVAGFHTNLAHALHLAGRDAEAVPALQRCVALAPDSAEAAFALGVGLRRVERWDDAEHWFHRAAALNPALPGPWGNLGTLARQAGRHDEALAAFEQAARLDPQSAETHFNLGVLWSDLGDRERALAGFQQAVKLQPDYPEAHLGISMVHLAHGDLAAGWPGYEWRWSLAKGKKMSGPEWDGRDLQGRTIIVYAEQGLGDTLQFCRYLPWVKARGAGRLILAAPPELHALLRCLPDVDQICGPGDAIPPYDCLVPLLSLPRLAGTTLDTIPAISPYLRADPQRVAAWRGRLGREGGGLKVGIVWRGSPVHRGNRWRSMPVAELAPLAGLPGVRLFSLQVPPPQPDELAALGAAGTVVDLGGELTNFAETAACLEVIDLVITVDTSVAHLAGALGRPAWVLLAFPSEWRWLRDRDDSPWYPSVRLFRQQRTGDWRSLLRQVCQALAPSGDSVRLDRGANF